MSEVATQSIGRIKLDQEGAVKTRRYKSRRRPQHLFDCWPDAIQRLHAAKHIVLFLDFDGTLASLKPRPEDNTIRESTRRALRRLAQNPRITLAIISGRRRADLCRRVKVRAALYLGLHGWEQTDKARLPTSSRKQLHRARRLIAERLRGLYGIWLEDKSLSFVVHYRGASPRAVDRAALTVRAVLRCVGSKLRQVDAAESWEILPRQIENKGANILKLLGSLDRPAFPIYVGDDASDETALAVLPQGLAIRVGLANHTAAKFFLRNPAEVTMFLRRLGEAIP